MTRVCHLLDEDGGWEQRVGIAQLSDRLPRERFGHTIATVERAPAAFRRSLAAPVHPLARPAGLNLLAAPALRKHFERYRIEVVHAWGAHAAAAARAATQRPLIIELFDPRTATRDIKIIRALARPSGFAVACATEIVRRRLIEGGVGAEHTVVIRPGVDFAQINQWKRGGTRAGLGVSREQTLVVAPESGPDQEGVVDAFMAAAMLNTLSGEIRFVVPGSGRDAKQLARLAAALPIPPTLVLAGDGVGVEELAAVSDVLIVAARGDVSTTAIAWAMASETAVIGSAVYAIAEMISSGVNGLLFKQTPGKSMVVAIARLLQDKDALVKGREVARGQAYEVFGLRRYAEQHMRLYENVQAGAAPSEGIADPAAAG